MSARWICLAALLCSGLAYAASEEDEPVEGDDEEIVVEAPRSPDQPTATRDVIPLDALRARYTTAPERLDLVAGVDVRDFGGPGQPRYVQLRGASPAQVVVLIDGVRVNPILGGGADLALVSLEGSGSVEVVRGPAGAVYGADAMGGVVRFLSDPRFSSRVAVTGGSFESARMGGRHRQPLGEGASFEIAGTLDRSLGNFRYRDRQRGDVIERDNNESRSGSLRLALDTVVGDGSLALRGSGSVLRAGSPGYDEFPTPEATRDTQQSFVQVQWTQPAGPGALDVSFHQRYENSRYENPTAFIGGGGLLQEHAATGAGATASWQGAVSDIVAVRLGADGRWERLLDGDYGQPHRFVGATAATATLSVTRLDLVGSVRGEWAERLGVALLPTAGARVALLPSLELRANVGRVYRLPSFLELYHPDQEIVRGNPDLRPERGVAGDVGLGWRFDPIRLDVTAFRQSIEQTILWAPVTPFRYEPVNTGKVRLGGVETSLAFVGEWGGLRFAHTHLETKQLDTGNPLPGRPEDRLAVAAQAGNQWITGFGEVAWTSESFVDFFGNLAVPGGTHVVAGVSAGPWKHFTATVEGKNLLDEDLRDSRYLPLPSRAFFVTVLWER